MTDPEHMIVGWDIGGAHVKACMVGVAGHAHPQTPQILDVAQWACPLWHGLEQLEQVLALAKQRWPTLGTTQHAITMTGEMVDLFPHRQEGVQRIAALLDTSLAPGKPSSSLHFFAGDAGWCSPEAVGEHWASMASANWLATAQHVVSSRTLSDGVLVDIGSTTTDLIAFKNGSVATRSRSDHERLVTGELVYQGVVRTPLCALARQLGFGGQSVNVMNEFFATTADIYRLTGELQPQHDLHPSADNGAKDAHATRQRLARMIGLDARDASADDWLALAQAWREIQAQYINTQLHRVMSLHGLAQGAAIVSAGCGDFLCAALTGLDGQPLPVLSYSRDVLGLSPGASDADAAPAADIADIPQWAQVCAPSVAVAHLLAAHLAQEQERR